jgi:hypothetical protein
MYAFRQCRGLGTGTVDASKNEQQRAGPVPEKRKRRKRGDEGPKALTRKLLVIEGGP